MVDEAVWEALADPATFAKYRRYVSVVLQLLSFVVNQVLDLLFTVFD